jgi:hypothetical protein
MANPIGTTNLGALIDSYAAIKTQIGGLEAQKRAIEEALAELPAGAYEGDDYRLSISDSVREGPDAELKAGDKAAVEAFRETLSRQYLTAHTVETTVRSHRVGIKTGKNLAA